MLQLPFYQVVVVTVSGIDGNGSVAGLSRDCEWVVRGRVGHAKDDHAPRLRPETLRMASLVRSVGEPCHVAVMVRMNKPDQAVTDFRPKTGLTEADSVKTEL